jgi:hypothetical protein
VLDDRMIDTAPGLRITATPESTIAFGPLNSST